MTERPGSRPDREPTAGPPRPGTALARHQAGRAGLAVLAVAAVAAGIAGTTGLPGTAAATASHPASTTASKPPARITLITGDVLLPHRTPAGGTGGTVLPAGHDGSAARLVTRTDGRHTYTYPQTAAPYVGHQLDRALFDVDGRGQAAHDQRVVLTYRPGHPHHAVPGVTATGGGAGTGGTVTGTVTAPKVFGAALAAQYAKDGGDPNRGTGLFADLASIAPAAGATPPVAHPDFPMHTLTVHGLGPDGRAAKADITVFDMDDSRKYSGYTALRDGTAKLSVPSGHYLTIAQIHGPKHASYYVTVPNTTVTKASTVTVDARKATSRLSVTTPRPAALQQVDVDLGVVDARGVKSGLLELDGAAPTWFAPTTKRPAAGDLRLATGFQLRSPASVSPGYDYTLRFQNAHTVAADQSYAPRASTLATVDATYASDGASNPSVDSVRAYYGWEPEDVTNAFDFTTPTRRTNYYSTGPDLFFTRNWDQSYRPDTTGTEGQWNDGFRTYRAGQHASTTWGGQPVHPRLAQRPVTLGTTQCPACHEGRKLDLYVDPFGDDEPGHSAYADSPTKGLTEKVDYTVTADGTKVASGHEGIYADVAMPAGAKTYRVDLDTTRRQAGLFELSDETHTSWSVPASASVALPKGWRCGQHETRSCSVVPLLTNSYHLPVDLHGSLASGATKAGLDLGHLAGASSKLGTPTVELSYDGGKTWKKASVTGGAGGHYGLAFTVPAKASTDGYGAVRLTAKDAAGSTLTQTVHRAFRVR